MLTRKRCRRLGRRRRPIVALGLELLEARCLLSGSAPLNETLGTADPLGSLDFGGHAEASAVIGAGPAGAADVYWYNFHLSGTESVHLSLQTGEVRSPLVGVLSLYNDAPYDQWAPTDPYTPTGHRLLAQDDAKAHGGDATIDRILGQGDYWVAVSGSGNDTFSTLIADSGLDGSTGAFRLSITTSDPGPDYDDPTVPVVLASDPAPGAELAQSPFVLRFDLNTAIDPTTIITYNDSCSDTAQLWFNTTNDFSFSPSCTATQINLSSATVSLEATANELLITPPAPLTAGYYEVILQGDGPGQTDYHLAFQIDGLPGNLDPTLQPGSTPGLPYEVPNITDGRLHQLAGAIGNDPTDPAGFDVNGVQYYHFSVAGPKPYGLDAELFAGRIGSPLAGALTLFRVDAGGNLEYVASNEGTRNTTLTTDKVNPQPLYTDPALFVPLTPGDYYLAVSSGQDYIDPTDPTAPWPFDPTQPDSGSFGNSTGPYVLNLLVQPPGPAPHVVSVAPDTGPGGGGPLTSIQVRFDEPVNLLSVAFQTYLQTQWQNGTLSAVTLSGPGNAPAPLRLESYDAVTNTATFVVLSAVTPGQYTLTLSGDGPDGIATFDGSPLVGNVPGPGEHDFVTTFRVFGSASGQTTVQSQPGNDYPGEAQPVGVLYPVQLSQGIFFKRGPTPKATDTEDDYSITVLQSRQYSFSFSGSGLPAQLTVSVLNTASEVEFSYTYNPHHPPQQFYLDAGTYVLRVSWVGKPAPYSIRLSYSGSAENPTPLVIGPGPALRVRLLTGTADGGAAATAAATTGGTAAPYVSPAASSSSALPGAFTLPSSTVLAQGFSPLDGVASAGGADAAGGALVVRAPAAPNTANALLGVLIVTQAPLDNAGDPAALSSPGDPAAVSSSSSPAVGVTTSQARLSPEMATRLLDSLFECWGRFATQAPAPAVRAPVQPETGDGGGEGALGTVLPGRGAAEGAPHAVREASWGWACAVAIGALLVPLRWRRGRRPDEDQVGPVGAAPSEKR